MCKWIYTRWPDASSRCQRSETRLDPIRDDEKITEAILTTGDVTTPVITRKQSDSFISSLHLAHHHLRDEYIYIYSAQLSSTGLVPVSSFLAFATISHQTFSVHSPPHQSGDSSPIQRCDLYQSRRLRHMRR